MNSASVIAIKGMLDRAPSSQVVTLHPSALTEMTELLTILAEHLPSVDPCEDRAVFEAFRSLIDRVVIDDRHHNHVDCEIIGTVAPLSGGNRGCDGSGGGI